MPVPIPLVRDTVRAILFLFAVVVIVVGLFVGLCQLLLPHI